MIIDFSSLQEGLTEIVSQLEDIKEENREELVDILDSYFDPEKEAIVPVVKKSFRSRRRSFKKDKSGRGSRDEQNGDQQPSSSPDSTTRSPRKRRPRRRQNNRRSFNKDGGDHKKNIEQSEGKVHLTEVTVGGN